MKMKKKSIYDISKEAGVSAATVSRVINNSAKVDFETRMRILKLFKKYNYRPRLVKNKIPTIGLIIGREIRSQIGLSDYNAGIMGGVIEYTDKHNLGISILIFSSEDIHHPEEIVTYLLEKNISGAIFVNPPEDSDYIYALEKINFPYVTIGSSFTSPDINSMDIDNEKGIKSALKLLVDHGHKNIGFITVDINQYDVVQRLKSYKNIMQSYQLPVDESNLHTIQSTSHDHKLLGYSYTKKIFENFSNRPTAFLCINDDIAVGVIKAFSELDLHVPKDVSIIGFDDYTHSKYMIPALTTIYNPIGRIGYEASEFVEQRIKGRDMKIQVIFESELVIRESCCVIH